MQQVFALLDTKEHCWLGTMDGPLTYSTKEKAELAARILDVRLQQPAGRTRAAPYSAGHYVFKDELHPRIAAEKAIYLLEEGLVM